MTSDDINICGAQLDRVARRIQAAERARREDYENEVLNAPPPPKQPPVSTYRLAGERQCMRATDGHDYTVTNKNKPNKGCDSSRRPPPPSPVELEPNTGCEINQDSYLDPCKHQPRVFVEIDRSASQAACETETNKDTKCGDESKVQLTKSDTNVKSKNDNKWCSNLPTPKNIPPPCKEPSLIERLRRRSGGTGNNSCSRRLHTQSSACSPMLLPKMSLKQKQTDTTTSVVQHEPQFAEAARGRIVTDRPSEKKLRYFSGGGIDLTIPPVTEAVRVQVSFDFNSPPALSSTDNLVHSPTNNTFNNTISTSNAWLSIKSLQKKLKDYKYTENGKESKRTEKRPACENPNISENKQNPCAPTLRNTSTKHNNFSRPPADLIALT